MISAIFTLITCTLALQFQNAQSSECLQALGPMNTLSLTSCDVSDSKSTFKIGNSKQKSGVIKTNVPSYCIDIAPGRDNQTVISLPCQDAQAWEMVPTAQGTFTIQQTNFEGVVLCLEPNGSEVDVFTCDPTLPDQFWKFFG
ncbi:hypothetical protein HK103_007125 [Boothiomyces macroporosus]|uniref:Ricin B lectin domain-containing protein n=1 Tax=Boothiomyces macroporosus TaxID=261099 RepID=A0AAD5UCY0_9FUNG|nr:hypothetical protein HK103_007125 [Boothiomyces macroporosus]